MLVRTDVHMSSQTTAARLPFADEGDLARALAALDDRAWRQLFEENYGRMYAYAYLRLGNADDAEDVASAVFTEAVRSISTFRYRGIPVASWLYRIAHHETVDALKRRRSALPLEDDHAVATDGAAFTAIEDRHTLGAALGAVKTEHREVLLLRFVEDRSVRDTAAALRKSEGAVKVLQTRALRALRSKLGGSPDDA
jgi:RNA polymerase sigma-70 factor (ECF subfamily)